jgi:MoaA/NifB/PqqE/SkfB family radical SAM enzyme
VPHPDLPNTTEAGVVPAAVASYVVFAPHGQPLDPRQLEGQSKYLDENPDRPYQNWLGTANEPGVPDEARYRLGYEVMAALHQRGIAPPPTVMIRKRALEDAARLPSTSALASRSDDDLRLLLSACLPYPMVAPEYVQIGPIDACNAQCLFCVHHSPLIDHSAHAYKSMLSWDAWRQSLDDLIAMKTPRVDYVGVGEPLMHPRIADALAYGSRHLKQNIISNGLLLKRHVRTIADHVDWLTVSLNAVTAKTQHTLHLTGERGFDAAVEGIRQLVAMTQKRGQVSISFVVNKENFREVADLPRFCHDLGIHAGITPVGLYDGTRERLGLDAAERHELADILARLRETPDHRILNLDQFQQFENRDSTFVVDQIPCYIGLIFAQIRGDGSVSHCCACDHEPIGNVNARTFADIWLSERYRQFRKDALFTIMATQQSLPGCHCDICGFAPESVRVHNRLHGTNLTLADLKATAPVRFKVSTGAVPVMLYRSPDPRGRLDRVNMA